MFASLILVLALTSPRQETPYSYEAEGIVEHVFFGSAGKPVSRDWRQFRVAVSGKWWVIRTTRAEDGVYTEVGGNGVDTFTFNTFPEKLFFGAPPDLLVTNRLTGTVTRSPRVSTNLLTIPQSSRWNRGLAEVQAGPVPANVEALVTPVWIAYASGLYYRSRAGQGVRPVWVPTDPEIAYGTDEFPAKLHLTESFPYLPTSVAYFSDGQGRLRFGNRHLVFRLDPPYQNGFTNAIFETNLRTNLAGFDLPVRSSLTMYCQQAEAPASSNDLIRCHTWIVQATQCRTSEPLVTFLPATPPQSLVIDRRTEPELPARVGMHYLTTVSNQWIPDGRSVKAEPLFTASVSEHRLRQRSNVVLVSRTFVVGCFLLPFLWLGWPLIRGSMNRGQNQKQTASNEEHNNMVHKSVQAGADL